jgi:AcrR family transcriptional regulator
MKALANSDEKLDRRVRRTRRQLCEAMLALLVERDYESITVQEITERADLNRATFYHHFNHKDELLTAALEDRFDELVASFGELPKGNAIWGDHTPELLTFRHIAEHADLYKVLLGERGMGHVIHRIINYIARFTQNKLLTAHPSRTPSNITEAVIAHHVAGSLFALMSWWVTNNLPYTPEEMAEMAHILCTNGVAAVLGAETEAIHSSARENRR